MGLGLGGPAHYHTKITLRCTKRASEGGWLRKHQKQLMKWNSSDLIGDFPYVTPFRVTFENIYEKQETLARATSWQRARHYWGGNPPAIGTTNYH